MSTLPTHITEQLQAITNADAILSSLQTVLYANITEQKLTSHQMLEIYKQLPDNGEIQNRLYWKIYHQNDCFMDLEGTPTDYGFEFIDHDGEVTAEDFIDAVEAKEKYDENVSWLEEHGYTETKHHEMTRSILSMWKNLAGEIITLEINYYGV